MTILYLFGVVVARMVVWYVFKLSVLWLGWLLVFVIVIGVIQVFIIEVNSLFGKVQCRFGECSSWSWTILCLLVVRLWWFPALFTSRDQDHHIAALNDLLWLWKSNETSRVSWWFKIILGWMFPLLWYSYNIIIFSLLCDYLQILEPGYWVLLCFKLCSISTPNI